MIDTAVILAAGRGSRLGEVTRTRSKAMVPVLGLPLIERVMQELKQSGVSHYIIVAAPTDDELKRYFSQRHHVVVLEQSVPRGSGDALRVCKEHVGESFLVSACDSLILAEDIQNLCELHQREAGLATLAVLEVSSETSLADRSVVKLRGSEVLDLIEKPGPGERISDTTCLPLYVCSHSIFESLVTLEVSNRGEYELPRSFSKLAREGHRILAQHVSQRLDVTNQQDLLKVNAHFLQKLGDRVVVSPDALVSPAAVVEGPALIGPGCRVEEGAFIGPFAYLEAHVTVAPDSVLAHAVILRGAKIEGIARDGVFF